MTGLIVGAVDAVQEVECLGCCIAFPLSRGIGSRTHDGGMRCDAPGSGRRTVGDTSRVTAVGRGTFETKWEKLRLWMDGGLTDGVSRDQQRHYR